MFCAEPLGEIQFAVVELSTKLDYESWQVLIFLLTYLSFIRVSGAVTVSEYL